jgi:hypothetical protein
MLKLRRLGLSKSKEKKKSTRVSTNTPQLRLMGLRHRELKEGETRKESHQMKLNGQAVALLSLQKGDNIDILQREDGTFMIAKVKEGEGRSLSANKNTNALSLTFTLAHNLMKEISEVFEITNETYGSCNTEDQEEKETLGSYNWHIMVPVNTETVLEASSENKVEEKVEENVNF